MVILDLYEKGNFNEYGGELGETDWPFVLTLEQEGIEELKAALDETLGDLYSGGMDAMLADYADDLDTRLAAVRGVL